MNSRVASVAALASLASFVGYCIYFDSKRRRDPEYRRNVHNRREYVRQLSRSQNDLYLSSIKSEVIKYFLQNVYWGEMHAKQNDWHRAVRCFANAIMICADPGILLIKLQKVIPKELYDQIMVRVRLLIHKEDTWSTTISSSVDTLDETNDGDDDSVVDIAGNTVSTEEEGLLYTHAHTHEHTHSHN